jgi:acyl-homoserine-lactone acylase
MKYFILFFMTCSCLSASAQVDPGQITIVRDRWGVPHIFSPTDAATAYGLAWAHAEDDFTNIQYGLLGGKQMLGRAIGRKGAEADYVSALLRCRDVVEAQYQTLSPAFLKVVDGYVQGLNAYARAHLEKVLVKKAFPITGKDYLTSVTFSLCIISGMDEVLPRVLKGDMPEMQEASRKGSNAFAIHPSRTTTGESFLGINSHQPLDGPVAWYEAHLQSDEGTNILGGLFPGGLCIFLGVNEHLGWAHTVNNMDKIDVYKLQMREGSDREYLFDGKWEPLEKRKVSLHVKGIPVAVSKNLYWSRYGATVKTPNGFYSISLMANQGIGGMEQWWRMNKARNFSEFYGAISAQGLPMFNIVYADRYDTIFYISGGRMPIRDTAYDWKGTLPGNTSRTVWKGWHPIGDLPQYVNPRSGYLYNTNHSPFLATAVSDNHAPSSADPTSGYETLHNNRSARFAELIDTSGTIDYDAFKHMKYDNRFPTRFHFPLDVNSLELVNANTDTALAAVVRDYREWDRRADAGSRGAAVFKLIFMYFTEELHMSSGTASADQSAAAFRYAKDHELKYFDHTGISLGELQQLERGGRSLPSWGLPDVLTAIYTDHGANGRQKDAAGESYIEMVRFPKNGLPLIESVNCYGASNDPSSSHYTDQMDLFIRQQLKPMTLDKEKVLREAEKIYHPIAEAPSQ